MSNSKQLKYCLMLCSGIMFLLLTGCTRVTVTVQDMQQEPIEAARVIINDESLQADARGRVKLLDKVWQLFPPTIISVSCDGYFSETLPYPSRSATVTLKKYNELPSAVVHEVLTSLGIDGTDVVMMSSRGKILIELANNNRLCLRMRDQRVLGYFILREEGVYHYDGTGAELFHDSLVDGVPLRTMASGKKISFYEDPYVKYQQRRGIHDAPLHSSSRVGIEFWGSIFEALFRSL